MMSPERRTRVIVALRELHAALLVIRFDGSPDGSCQLERRSDAELTVMLANAEALLERAQGTDI